MLRIHPALLIVLPLLLLCTGVLMSCSITEEDDDSISRPFAESGPPTLPLPKVRISPAIGSMDDIARHARATVIGAFNRIRLVSQDAESAHATLNGKGWGIASESCRYRRVGQAADTLCSFTLYVCDVGNGYEWNEIVDGPCGVSGGQLDSYNNWTRFTGLTSHDGLSGSFEIYHDKSAAISRTWSWHASADGRVIDWKFYKWPRFGSLSLVGLLHWDRTDDDFERGEFEWDNFWKWSAEVTPDGWEGRMTIYHRSSLAGEWYKQTMIDWTPGHGTYSTYDSAGSLVEERGW